jgi:hypothetical protein
MDWNTDPSRLEGRIPSFAPHVVDTPEHTNPNAAGVIMARSYLPIAGAPPGTRGAPYVIVRDVASGCAYPAAYALQNLQVVATNWNGGPRDGWTARRPTCTAFMRTIIFRSFALPTTRRAQWFNSTRGAEYVPGAIPDGSYVSAPVTSGEPATLAANRRVMRVRFQMPTTPPTPCASGCSISGNEQLRYMSLSFLKVPVAATLASLADSSLRPERERRCHPDRGHRGDHSSAGSRRLMATRSWI